MTDAGRECLEPCPVCGERQQDHSLMCGECHIYCGYCGHGGPIVYAPCENPIGAAMVLWNRAAKGEI